MYSTSPPTKSSLVSWWKTFKMRPKDHGDLTASPPPQMIGGPSPGSIGMLERPKLPHMSRSNGEWSTFNSAKALDEELEESVIFGVPLATSIHYANVSISLTDPNGEQFIYGHIPIVVAKCGVFLKEHATEVEGIFRVSGSAKRMRDLQRLFNTPPRYGKGLDWSGFNVHDAANVLRRYLNHLPEPIVPLEFYEQFRKPLRNSPSILEYIDNKSPVVNPTSDVNSEATPDAAPDTDSNTNTNGDAKTNLVEGSTTSLVSMTTTSSIQSMPNPDDPLYQEITQAVAAYQELIAKLPNLNRQLLMYILDLLAVFSSKSEENLMPAPNLAAIFQPSILFHPDHDMMPREYRLSRSVIEFMIEHSNKFLSTIETIAREEHARNKELGIKPMSPSPQVSSVGEPPATGRRHSKSLSSVNAPALKNPPREMLVVRKPRESDKEAVPPSATSTPEKSGLLNTIKRASSLSRRPSQRRSVSNSSQTSDAPKGSSISRAFRKNSVKSDEGSQSPAPSIQINQIPAADPETASTNAGSFTSSNIGSMTSPRMLSPSSELKMMSGSEDGRPVSHEKSSSPRFRVLGNVFGHNNDSTNPTSGMARSISSSSMDGDGVGAEERPKSRWRRSFIFMQPNNSSPAVDDPNYPTPAVRSPGEVSMDDYSMSPSKLSFFKRMRSRERSHDEHSVNATSDVEPPTAPPTSNPAPATSPPITKKPVGTSTTTGIKKVPVQSATSGQVSHGHVVHGQPVVVSPTSQVQPQTAVPQTAVPQTAVYSENGPTQNESQPNPDPEPTQPRATSP